LKITLILGRSKDILIISSGSKVSPLSVEADIATALPCLSEVVVVGEGRANLVAFLSLDIDRDNGEEDDILLSKRAIHWCRQVAGSEASTVSDIVDKHDEAVFYSIQVRLNTFNNCLDLKAYPWSRAL